MAPTLIRFGTFEVDLQTSEIRKAGVKIRLEGQPFQILKLLLERPGQLVTREELKRQLWAGDTFVDFEVGINAAVKRLRQALDDSADVPRFVETLPRRGYRFICSIERSIDAPDTAPHVPPIEVATPSAPVAVADGQWRGQRGTALVFAIVVIALMGSLAFNLAGLRDWLWGSHTPVRIAVLRLDNLTGSAESAYVLGAIQHQLTTNLAGFHGLEVRSIASVNGLYRANEQPPADIAERLGADYLVEGSVSRSGKLFRVTLSVTDAQNTIVWNDSRDREDDGTWSLCADVAAAIARHLGVVPTPFEEQQLVKLKAQDPKAAEVYLRGSVVENDPSRQIDYFQTAIRLDDRFADPHQGVASAYVGLGMKGEIHPYEAFETARIEASRALLLDSTLSRAHVTLAQVAYMYDWDSREADRQQALARQFNPDAIGTNNLLFAGQYQQAIDGFRRQAVRDPASVGASRSLGWALAVAGRYADAIAQYTKTLRMNSADPATHAHLALVLALTGQNTEAVTECDTALRRKAEQKQIDASQIDQNMLGGCGWVYAVARHDAEAAEMIQAIRNRAPERFVDPFQLARIYDGLGKTDEAIDYFEIAYELRSSQMFTLRADPRITAKTRGNHRFQELLDKIPLPFRVTPPTGFQLQVRR